MRKNFSLLLLFILFSLLRLINLSADPSPLLPPTVAGDEGYWIHHARINALDINFSQDEFREDLTVAPLFSFLQSIIFKIFGVSFFTARLVSVFLSLWGLWLFHRFTRSLFLTSLLGFNPLFIAMNRVALPDVAAFLFLILALIAWEKQHPLKFTLSLFALLLMKTTNFFILPVFLILVFLNRYRSGQKRFIFLIIKYCLLISVLFIPIILKYWPIVKFSYFSSSGQDFLPHNWSQIPFNIWNTLINSFWSRISVIPLTILALASLNNRTRLSKIGLAILVGGLIFILPTLNQGSDHRFWHILVALVLLVPVKKIKVKISTWQLPLITILALSFINYLSYEFFKLGYGTISFKLILFISLLFVTIIYWLLCRTSFLIYLIKLTPIYFCFFSLAIILRPTWSLANASQWLAEKTENEQTISGLFSHQLAIQTDLYPIYYWFNQQKDYQVNQELAQSADLKINFPAQGQCRLYLYPDLLQQKPRLVLSINPSSLCEE